MKQILLSSFTFKGNHVFIGVEGNPSERVIIIEEQLDDVDIDGIGN